MPFIRAILNSGFFFIVLIVAVALYLAYSDNIKKDHGLIHTKTDQAIIATAEPKSEVATIAIAEKPDMEAPILETTAEQTEAAPLVTPSTEAVAAPTAAKNSQVIVEAPPKETPTVQTVSADSPPSQATVESSPIITPAFKTMGEALTAARNAALNKEFITAEKIYFELAEKSPTATVLVELGNILQADGKTDWAHQAWLESAKLLVADNRFNDSMQLAHYLSSIAPKVAREIGMNTTKIRAARAMQNNQQIIAAQKELQARHKTQVQTRQAQQIPFNQPDLTQPIMPQAEISKQQARQQAYMQKMYQQQMAMQAQQKARYQAYIEQLRHQRTNKLAIQPTQP